ncbi:hypothetical protein [Streptomyces sp. NPDC018693]|uniref:hypothetical protein n=1 Tax=unclassified Streptomyces TaxID=2593676 RepID=UPI0037A6C977
MRAGVHRFLVTADDSERMRMWRRTAVYANWLDGRDNPRGGQTWLVTVFAEHGEDFLNAARATGATVEEIEGGGDDEQYHLRVGEPGSGWHTEEEAPR